ncbi:hypothetical protein K501DRAFT_86813 [Backusella circina FSU 941]|nr:hypothetical protein K501DRAFT_86813 [Backusella circina FSU 941]
MSKRIEDLFRSKTFTTFTCSPIYNLRCNYTRNHYRGTLLLNFLLKTNRFRLEQDLDRKRKAPSSFITNVISYVDYQELPFNKDDTSSQVLYRISIGLTKKTGNFSTNDLVLFPSNNDTLPEDFDSYPLILCRGDKELLLFVREWIQGFFNCTITKNPVSAQVLTNYTCWYSQALYNITVEDEEDVYELSQGRRYINLEYFREGAPELQHISLRLGSSDLIRLQESIQGKDETIIDAIGQFVLDNTSVNISTLTLRTAMTGSVAFHLDGKVKASSKRLKSDIPLIITK